MIDWFFDLDITNRIAFGSVVVVALGIIASLFNKKPKNKSDQHIEGNAEKVAQLRGDNAKIDIK